MSYAKPSCLRLDRLSWYKEVGITNGLGRTLYLLDSCNHIIEIMPDGNGLDSCSTGMYGDPDECTFIIQVVSRRIGELDDEGLPKAMVDNNGRIIFKREVKLKELKFNNYYRPVWIPELGSVISLEPNRSAMIKARPMFRSNYESNHFEIEVNVHRESISQMYVILFNKIITARVNHDLSEDEGFSVKIKPAGGPPLVLQDKFGAGYDLTCIKTLFAEYGIVMGTDSDAVRKAYNDLSNTNVKKVEELEAELEIIKKKNGLLEADNKILDKKLSDIIKEEKDIRETENLRLKSEAAHSDSIANMWKNIAAIIGAFSAIFLLVLKYAESKAAANAVHKICETTAGISIMDPRILTLILCILVAILIYKYRHQIVDKLEKGWNFLVDCTKKVCKSIANGTKEVVKATVTCTKKIVDATKRCAIKVIDTCSDIGKSVCGFVGSMFRKLF